MSADAPAGCAASAAEDPKVAALEDWLVAQGAVLKGVTAREADSGGGRGLFVTAPAVPHQLLLNIPRSAWLSSSTVLERSVVADILGSSEPEVVEYCQQDSLWLLVLALDAERHHPASHWRAYIDGLPDPSSPVQWAARELAGLESPGLAAEITHLQGHIEEVWRALVVPLASRHPQAFDTARNTLASFTWSALIVWSRVFNLARWNSTENGLMPLMDYANHRTHAATGTSWDSAAFDFEAATLLKAGEEVFISYGDDHTSVDFLLHYGFIPTESRFGDYIAVVAAIDSVTPPASLDPSSPVEVASFGGRRCLAARVGSDGWVNDKFLADAIHLVLGRAAAAASPEEATATAVAILTKMYHAIDGALAGFSSSLSEDEDELTRSGLSYVEWITLTTRSRYKRVLATLRETVKHRIDHGGDWHSVADEQVWGRSKDRNIVHVMDDTTPLSGDVQLREALYHLHIEL